MTPIGNILGGIGFAVWLLVGAFQAVSEGSLVGKVLVAVLAVGVVAAWLQELRRNS